MSQPIDDGFRADLALMCGAEIPDADWPVLRKAIRALCEGRTLGPAKNARGHVCMALSAPPGGEGKPGAMARRVAEPRKVARAVAAACRKEGLTPLAAALALAKGE